MQNRSVLSLSSGLALLGPEVPLSRWHHQGHDCYGHGAVLSQALVRTIV